MIERSLVFKENEKAFIIEKAILSPVKLPGPLDKINPSTSFIAIFEFLKCNL